MEYQTMQYIKAFQSPPSVRKATQYSAVLVEAAEFQSSPSVRKATADIILANEWILFQSPPSVRKATAIFNKKLQKHRA